MKRFICLRARQIAALHTSALWRPSAGSVAISYGQSHDQCNSWSYAQRPEKHLFHLTHGWKRDSSTFVSKHFRLEPGEVESFLRRHNLKTRVTEEHAVVEECPFCHPTKGRSDNLYKLYVKRDAGAYKCHRCHASGSWFDLRKRLGRYEGRFELVRPSTPKENAVNAQHKRVQAATHTLTQEQEKYVLDLWTVHGPARQYLRNVRGLSEEVSKKYGIGAGHFHVMDDGEWKRHLCITFPMYNGNGELVRHKIRSIDTKSGMRLEPKGGEWGMFGLDVIAPDADEVIITEGEFDALSVFQGTGRPALSLPNGASSLPNDLLPALEKFKTIYLWMDNDAAGQDGASHFSRKLGLNRCRSVSDAKCKDANDALREKRDMSAILDQATVVPHDALLTFDDMRGQVFSHLVNMDSSQGVKSQSIPNLNNFLGGLRQGELTIFSGHTGIGKTTILSQLALDYCMQDVPTVWGSFEIPNLRLISRVLRQFRGAHGDCANVLEDFNTWANRFAELPMYFMRYHGAEDLEVVIETMEYAHYVHDCRHFVLDNLQFMTATRGMDRFEKLDTAVGMIREFCTQRNAHVSLVVHPRKEADNEKIQTASVFGSAKATQEADNVIILQRGEHGSYLDVRKNRFNGKLGQIPLSFDPKRLLFMQDSSGRMGWAGKRSREHTKKCEEAKTEKSKATKPKATVRNGGDTAAAVNCVVEKVEIMESATQAIRSGKIEHEQGNWFKAVKEHRAVMDRVG